MNLEKRVVFRGIREMVEEPHELTEFDADSQGGFLRCPICGLLSPFVYVNIHGQPVMDCLNHGLIETASSEEMS